MNAVSDLPATSTALRSEDYSIERCAEIKTEVFSLLLELKGDGVATLHRILAGRCVTHQWIGRLETIREKILPQYAGCELRECDTLNYQSPQKAWLTARKVQP